jgi:hypothetical protein
LDQDRSVQLREAAGNHFFRNVLPKYNAGLDAKGCKILEDCRDGATLARRLPNHVVVAELGPATPVLAQK